MILRRHFTLTFDALRRWLIAQCYDAALVGLMWWVALWRLQVPGALFWALLGGLLQFIPHFGPVLALLGPALAILFSGAQWERFVGLLIAYAAIAVIDGLILQPYLMRRQNRVPVWASILAPLALGFVIPFWGVFLAPPLLAIIYAYRRPRQAGREGVHSGEALVLPPERPVHAQNARTAPVIESTPIIGGREDPYHGRDVRSRPSADHVRRADR